MLLLAFSIVVSLQAVGVVLVSAMLVTPAAAAYLLHRPIESHAGPGRGFWHDPRRRRGRLLLFVGHDMPTGPLMVLAPGARYSWRRCSSARAMASLPAGGNSARARRATRGARTRSRPSIMCWKNAAFQGDSVSLQELAEQRRETEDEARRLWAMSSLPPPPPHLATRPHDDADLFLTPAGWQRACEIVRNHRLWELYLTMLPRSRRRSRS